MRDYMCSEFSDYIYCNDHSYFYRSLTKLRKGNVFSRMYLFISLFTRRILYVIATDLFELVHLGSSPHLTPPHPPPQSCSNLFTWGPPVLALTPEYLSVWGPLTPPYLFKLVYYAQLIHL